MAEMIQANCCAAKWTGLTAAHCTGCHHTFTSVGAFDRHRRNDKCLPPETIGLVKADRDWPGWSWPGTWAGPKTA